MPSILHAAAGTTSTHMILPPRRKDVAAATLEARFPTLAHPEAVTMSRWSRAVKAMMRKVPVPGPTMPS